MLVQGIYLMRITDIIVNLERQYVAFTTDVAAGPCKGFFESSGTPSWGQHAFYLSFKNGYALQRTQIDLQHITEANGGFDVFDAFDAWEKDPMAFKGKLVFAAVSYRENEDAFGDVETLHAFNTMSAASLRAGAHTIPGLKHADGRREPQVEVNPVDVDALLAEAREVRA